MKIISGGQTGVDIAGLMAAKVCGLETGGFAPTGWRTQDGSRPELGTLYGLTQHSSSSYPPRTWANVQAADATLRIANKWHSAGESCTLGAIVRFNKPYLDIMYPWPDDKEQEVVDKIFAWLAKVKPAVLNIAGNSEKTCPGIEDDACRMLVLVFRKVKENG